MKDAIQKLAADFADSVLGFIKSQPLEELLGGRSVKSFSKAIVERASKPSKERSKKHPSGRLARRPLAEIDKAVDEIVEIVMDLGPMRAEQIRSYLNAEPREMPRILQRALDTKKLVIVEGQKRATTYGIAGKSKSKTASKPNRKATGKAKAPAKKAVPKPKRAAAKTPAKKAPKRVAAKK